MSRRKSNAAGEGVSLFPFLSILACLIGVLTMMIQIISQIKAAETNGRDEEELNRAKLHQQLQVKIKKHQQELAKINTALKQNNLASHDYNELDNKRIVLSKKLDDTKANPKETDETLQKLLERMIDQIAALKKERPKHESELASLKAELAKRNIKPDTKAIPVKISPGGSQMAANTHLVIMECNSTGLVILNKDGSKIPISLATIPTNPKLATAFNEAKSAKNHLLLFLIRPDGFAAYRDGTLNAEVKYQLSTGKLPVPSQGEIDLSLFYKK